MGRLIMVICVGRVEEGLMMEAAWVIMMRVLVVGGSKGRFLGRVM